MMHDIAQTKAYNNSLKQAGIALSLPPEVSLAPIYELFFFSNDAMNNDQKDFLRSLLINRSKHQAWSKISNYQDTINQIKQSKDTYYAFSRHSAIDCNVGANQAPSEKSTQLARDENNSERIAFKVAPIFKISFDGTILTIRSYNQGISEKVVDGGEERYVHSYEYYLAKTIPNYRINKNNLKSLLLPHAVSTTLVNPKFLFNVGALLLDSEDNSFHRCEIEFRDCLVKFNPTDLYNTTMAYKSVIGVDNTVFDMTSINWGPVGSLAGEFRSVNHAFKNITSGTVFDEKLKYMKLHVQGKGETSQIIYKGFKPKLDNDILNNAGITDPSDQKAIQNRIFPAELTDLRDILYTLPIWFDGKYGRTHNLPEFRGINS